ncbi:MAG: LysM peptidoglycan-binding domain-containing protein, partial [Betaproteobacteria bacterium]
MRVKPYITGGVLAGVLTLAMPALALGLGKLTVQSSLGQPLSAKIELTSAQQGELDSLRARIADPSVYRDNSVQYVGALARARVSVEQGPNNIPYLKVTSPQAVNEPYLDLIVELSWATGRVVRDYTFLLDPPGTAEMQAAAEPVRPPRAEAASPPARSGRPAARPVESAGTTPGTTATPGPAPVGGTYTVKRGDTLSKIAGEYKPDNVSLEQMLVALFRSNESAFDGGNMNRLRSGQIITVPQGDQIAAVAPPEATQMVKMQAADWRAYRDRVAAGAPASAATGSTPAAGGRITTAVQDQASAAQPGKDQLRVSRESGKGAAAGAAQVEDSVAKDKALREANARVAELEKAVRDLQKAAELRNQTLAELQARADTAAGKSVSPAKIEQPKVAAAKTEAPKAEPAKTEAPKVASAIPPAVTPSATTAPVAPSPSVPATPEAKAPETKAPDSTPPTPAVAPAVKGPDTSTPATSAVAPVVKGPDTSTPPLAKTTTPAKKPAEPSFIDDLFGNTPTWAIGGGALIVLAGIAGIIAARRRKTTKFEDSIISGTDIKTNTVFGSTGGGVVNTGDNSLASDFSREGLGNIDTDEVDPIAEAEVYLAYGRDAQAEEILKDALKKDPKRQEIYLKLLEIHAQHNKPSAFETVASELYSVSGGRGETWQKAMALGRQLDPTNP